MVSIASLALAAVPARQAGEPRAQGPAQSLVLHDEGYVGSAACAECHEQNHASWRASFHRRMTQAPSSEAVLAPFRGTTPVLEGRAWTLAQEGEAFFATPVDAQGTALGPRARLALLTGSHHFQVYWLATSAGALEQLPQIWDVTEGRWIPRRSTFLAPLGPSGSEADRWQAVCIQCHATNGTPAHPSGATRVAELGIACEACHGPGERHVAFRKAAESKEAREPDTGLVDPSALAPERSAEVCGQCHAIHPLIDAEQRAAWERDGFPFRPGDDLAATRALLSGRAADNPPELRAFVARMPSVLSEHFWSDGEVRVSGREYNGLVESPCYAKGSGERRLTCLTCHEMHVTSERLAAGWSTDQLRPGMDGPAACLGCHAPLRESAALAAHTRHAPGSSGSDCLNCHMPYTTYGLMKAIRSHTITSPSVAASLATGRPNACNQCHLDKSLGWAAERLSAWTGAARPALDADQAATAASVLWALSGDAGQRALAAWTLGWASARAVSGTGWMPYVLSTLLLDEYDAVRVLAQRAARLDPRWRGLALDLCQPLEEQRNQVRATVLGDWLATGLEARAEQREAVLVLPDGKLDEARFRRLYARRDNRPVRLGE